MLASVKLFACRFILVMEFCRDCGRKVEQVWTSDDALWAEVATDEKGPPLCIRCFDARARNLGKILRWVPHVSYEKRG